jgi:hypothetical protein
VDDPDEVESVSVFDKSASGPAWEYHVAIEHRSVDKRRGKPRSDVADRAVTTPDVIRRYYDRPDLDENLRRRVIEFDGIDICEHSDPTDIDGKIDSRITDSTQL